MQNEHQPGDTNMILFETDSNDENKMALFEFKSDTRDEIVKLLTGNFLTTGSYTSHGGTVSKQSIMSMVNAGMSAGALAASASFSETLFMATAPSTALPLSVSASAQQSWGQRG
jgi:hypothetical protein